eukprot:m.9662 g.9662  ORF g.9662 m.9662 type:complete len:510 (+) comp4204_c0_seq1:42-1571(+)
MGFKKRSSTKGDTDSLDSFGTGASVRRSKVDDKIMDAVMKKDHKTLRQLIDKGKFTALHAPNQYGQYSLITACEFRSAECVEILMDADNKIRDVRDTAGRGAVHLVAESGMTDIMGVLVRKGADIDWADPRGLTPIHLAAMEGHEVIVQLLIGYSAPMNAVDKEGNTALMLACKRGHGSAVDRLINGGADLNLVNAKQRTALMYACETGLVHSVKLLVDKGAKTSLKDAEGATAREIATLAGHDNCVAALPVNAYLGNLAATTSVVEGGASAIRTGQNLIADMMKEVESLKSELAERTSALEKEQQKTRKLEEDAVSMQSQLETFKSLDGPGDDLFDDMDDLLDLDEGAGNESERVVKEMSAEGRELVEKLRRDNVAAHFENVTLTEQLQQLGVVPSSTTGMTKAGELARLRRRNHELEEQLSSLSGDVVPLAIVERLKDEHERKVKELKLELEEAAESVVAAAEETDYTNLDALEAKIVMYRRLLVEAITGVMTAEVRAEIEALASER